MQTFKRICIKDYVLRDGSLEWKLVRGQEYITSAVGEAPRILEIEPRDEHVVVMDKYWVSVPVSLFTGEVEFTK
jgi:hypothetical protein